MVIKSCYGPSMTFRAIDGEAMTHLPTFDCYGSATMRSAPDPSPAIFGSYADMLDRPCIDDESGKRMVPKIVGIAASVALSVIASVSAEAYANSPEMLTLHEFYCDEATLHYVGTEEFTDKDGSGHRQIDSLSATNCRTVEGSLSVGSLGALAVKAKSLTVITKTGKQEKYKDIWVSCEAGDGGDGSGLIVGERCSSPDVVPRRSLGIE